MALPRTHPALASLVALLLVLVMIATVSPTRPAFSAEVGKAEIVSVVATGRDADNVASNMLDDDPATRWSAAGRANGNGDKGPSATFTLNGRYLLSAANIDFYAGDNGNPTTFSLETSLDGTTWTSVTKATSTGTTRDAETFPFEPTEAAYVRYVGEGRKTSVWNSVTEFELTGKKLAPQAPAPEPQPVVDEPQPVVDEPQPVVDEPAPTTTISHGSDLELADVGPVHGVPLKASGAITTSKNGQVIENLHVTAPGNISAAIIIDHDNVTVRNVRVTSPGFTSGIRVQAGTTGTLIEHVEIDGRKAEYGTGRDDANWGNVGIKAFAPFTGRRNHIYDVRQNIQMWRDATASTIVENWIGEVWRNASGVSTSGISYRGSGNRDLSTIARNRIENSAMSGIGISARDGGAINVVVKDNLIIGTTSAQGLQAGYGIRGGYQGDSREENRDIKIEGNRFAGAFEWGTNGGVNTSQPGNTFTNNRMVGSNTDIAPKRTL